jgi:hypothetical protein
MVEEQKENETQRVKAVYKMLESNAVHLESVLIFLFSFLLEHLRFFLQDRLAVSSRKECPLMIRNCAQMLVINSERCITSSAYAC